MKILRRDNVHAYQLIKSVQWNHLDPVDPEIYLNTYRKLVDSTLSVNRSGEISAINFLFVTGKN